MPRGGNHGGGTTIRRIWLSGVAARYVRGHTQSEDGRQTQEAAEAWVNARLEGEANGCVAPILVTDDIRAAIVWLAEQRGALPHDTPEARGIDQLIAAIWTAEARNGKA